MKTSNLLMDRIFVENKLFSHVVSILEKITFIIISIKSNLSI